MFDTIELMETGGFTSLCGPNAGKQRRAVHPRRPRLPGNPYGGYALTAQIVQTERITGIEIDRLCRSRLPQRMTLKACR
jgi:hypothetical protein